MLLPPTLTVNEPAPAANPPPVAVHSNLFDPEVAKPRVNVPALLLLDCYTPPLRVRKPLGKLTCNTPPSIEVGPL